MIARFLGVIATLAALPVYADDQFYGVWQGLALEEGSKAPYPVTLSIFEKDGRIFQHSTYGAPLECVGGGVLIEKSADALHLSEVIIANRAMCASGTIRVYLNGEENLIWEWFFPSGKYAARADLKRRGD